MSYFNLIPFWKKAAYEDAHLSKIELPDDVLEKIITWWKKPVGILFFAGNPGCGKTYLIAAMIHAIEESKKFPFRYFSERDFYSHLRACIDKNWDYEWEIQRLCETYMFFLDDIGFCQATPFQKECFCSLVDERIQSKLPTVITSNIFLDQMSETYHPRLVSRLKAKENTVIELNWYDKRQAHESDKP